MKVQEAIKLINNSSDIYCISDAIDLLDGTEFKLVEGVNINKHRWYETSESYFKLEDGIIGIYGVSNIYFEHMNVSDCNIHTQAFEGEEIITFSYRCKKPSK